MPRFHNINGTHVQFTSAEETARDAEEAQAVVAMATAAERDTEIAALKAKISDGTATYAELLEFMQYQTGSK